MMMVVVVVVAAPLPRSMKGSDGMAINNKLLRLTKQEKRIVQERLGVSVPEAIRLLYAAYEWATETTTPQEFESRFAEFVAAHGLNPVMADVAGDFVLSLTASYEEQEIDRRGFELLVSRKPSEDWTEADEQTWAAFMESCKKENEQATASMKLFCGNLIDRDKPTTREEVKEMQGLAHLREWARSQIN
jgi:hypothetical protein